ncbi:MAG: ATP-dependent DNA helicase RecG [Candidatus Margulisbacteria bacterium]|nr:ATP-dependent DNA helicase RecG [Candidatus Margulisiibacteriota bacterium]
MNHKGLDTPIQYVKGVGPKVSQRLATMNILNMKDFLYTFPRTYDDRRSLPSISDLSLSTPTTIKGRLISLTENKPRPGLNILKGMIQDETGSIAAIWFNQGFLKRVLKIDTQVVLSGKVTVNSFQSERQFSVANTEVISAEDPSLYVGQVLPIYALVSGLIQLQMRKIAKSIITQYGPLLQDPLPPYLMNQYQFFSLSDAIKEMHFPSSREYFQSAKKRLVFEEFFYGQLILEKRRMLSKQNIPGPQFVVGGPPSKQFIDALPYRLTKAQERAISDIETDVSSPHPMNRLIQGDVGSGKTDVAMAALMMAISSGFNGAMMVPTEILAEQHYRTLKERLSPFNVSIMLLKGKLKVSEKKEAQLQLSSAKRTIVVGTHALYQDPVVINQLGLVVVDEQHRFGVFQRMKLKDKGHSPHCLFMTATPIPRSLMLTVYGDLDKTIIDELPPGRVAPKTYVLKEGGLTKVYSFCHQELQKGYQIYIVYPLVEESEKIDLNSAVQGYDILKSQVFTHHKVDLIHGKMKSEEKEAVMNRFKKGTTQVLVSTTVIEVGIDVPNATIMVIRHAERFGLSQLHQLRGRIGRGGTASTCFLITSPNVSATKDRLQAMASTSDGFKIAEYDLAIRGPGDMLGSRQSGLPSLQLADLVKDEKILLIAREEAKKLLQQDPLLVESHHQNLKRHVLSMKNSCFSEGQLN